MKNLVKLMIVSAVWILLAGCWDRQEINDIAIVIGTSFDLLDENTYQIAIQLPLPGQMGGSGSGGGGGGTSGDALFYLDAGIGRSVREANADVQQRMSRQLMFGHRRIAIFGHDLARLGLKESLDVLTRTREARLTTQIFVTEGKGLEILSANPQLETLSSEVVRELGVNRHHLTLKKFLLDHQQKGNGPILPVLSIVQNKNPDPSLVEDQIEINKVAIFKNDRLEFMTDEKQTSAVDWILAKKEGSFYSFEMGREKEIVLRITEQTTDISYDIRDGRPFFHFTIDAITSMTENQTDLNIEDRGALDQVSQKFQEAVQEEVQSLLDETFSKGIDSFGLGWLLHRRETNRWEQEWKPVWREMLPQIGYEVEVNSSVEYTGLITQGIGLGE